MLKPTIDVAIARSNAIVSARLRKIELAILLSGLMNTAAIMWFYLILFRGGL